MKQPYKVYYNALQNDGCIYVLAIGIMSRAGVTAVLSTDGDLQFRLVTTEPSNPTLEVLEPFSVAACVRGSARSVSVTDEDGVHQVQVSGRLLPTVKFGELGDPGTWSTGIGASV
jgi:hypothetical protein